MNEQQVFDDIEAAIQALRAEYPDVVTSDGHVINAPDNSVDGSIRHLAIDPADLKRVPTKVLRRMHAGMLEDQQRLDRKRERLQEYAARLSALADQFGAAIQDLDDE